MYICLSYMYICLSEIKSTKVYSTMIGNKETYYSTVVIHCSNMYSHLVVF